MPLRTLPPLYAIANIDDQRDPLGYVERLLRAGARLIQIRAKSTPIDQLSDLVRAALHAAKSGTTSDSCSDRATIIVNDSVAICRATGADGVHLGQHDSDPREARELLGPDAIIGLSTHNRLDVERAQLLPIDYIGCGPIFASPTKQGHAPEVGLDELTAICKGSRLPVVAIGGINRSNASAVFEAGAVAVAAISDLASAPDLGAAIAEFTRYSKRLLAPQR